jgi:hypothetical protein
VTRSILPVDRPRRFRVRAALLGALAVLACSFQDFDYLQDGKAGAPAAATGGRNPWNNGGYSGNQPWPDDDRGGRRPGNWGGAPGVGGNVQAGGESTGGALAPSSGGSDGATDSGGAAGA